MEAGMIIAKCQLPNCRHSNGRCPSVLLRIMQASSVLIKKSLTIAELQGTPKLGDCLSTLFPLIWAPDRNRAYSYYKSKRPATDSLAASIIMVANLGLLE